MVGRAIKSKRDDVVLATKGFMPIGEGPNDRGLGRKYLTRALEASLRRLGTDYVDLYQCHAPDADTPIEETMATLHGFVESGKVRYIGCSNWTGSQIVEAQWAASVAHTTPFVSLQPRYSLTARQIEDDVLPACQRQGLGTMVYSPLGGGVLTGKYHKGEEPPADSRAGRGGGWGGRMLDDNSLDTAEVGRQGRRRARRHVDRGRHRLGAGSSGRHRRSSSGRARSTSTSRTWRASTSSSSPPWSSASATPRAGPDSRDQGCG